MTDTNRRRRAAQSQNHRRAPTDPDLLARGQRHYHDGALAAGIEHVWLEIDGGVLGGNGGQIARGGMTVLAATGSIEKHLSGPWIASKQFLYWVFARDPSRI